MTPDALSNDLFRSGPAIIEITALSDDAFSGEKVMNRAANIIDQFAEGVRRGASKNLFFEFGAPLHFERGLYQRVRLVSNAFELTPAFKDALRSWLSAPDWPNPAAIRLKDRHTDVIVSWKDYVHPMSRVFSPVAPIAYDLERNPLYSALKAKRRKLSSAPGGTLKCIFVGDAGSWMLRELRSLHNPTREAKSGEQVIKHFLTKSSSIDVVCVFSPGRRGGSYNPRGGEHFYDRGRSSDQDEYSKLKALVAQLPAPRIEGHRARSLHRQGLFRPQARGWYVGASVMSDSKSTSVRISARRLQELLAGRIQPQQFEQRSGMMHVLDAALKRGLTIQDARVEKAGLDEDDDFLIFELKVDAAAAPLTKPKVSRRTQNN